MTMIVASITRLYPHLIVERLVTHSRPPPARRLPVSILAPVVNTSSNYQNTRTRTDTKTKTGTNTKMNTSTDTKTKAIMATKTKTKKTITDTRTKTKMNTDTKMNTKTKATKTKTKTETNTNTSRPRLMFPRARILEASLVCRSRLLVASRPTLSLTSPPASKTSNSPKKLREQARRKGREMSEARSRAKSARKKGRLGAAHAHKQDAIAHESEMQAAKIFFKENNKDRREGGKIDLHGLCVAEAIQVANAQLQIARLRRDEVVRFIVGKGLHSDAGGAKIRPALEDLVTKRGLIHSLDPYNSGVLIVQLD
ncbi:hypothetical protein EDB85DRAFT_595977 [Lactarius pseudohatsudake]|nr:hypothetical protein EDB85DRAFT_595977 [Lactarius pseudohatsudake]